MRILLKIWFCLALLLGWSYCEGAAPPELKAELISLNEELHISRANTSSLENISDVAQGFQQCGGQGKLLKWRYHACSSSSESACVVPADHFDHGEVTFIASKNLTSLGLKIRLSDQAQEDQELAAFHNPSLPDSNVEAGKEYALTAGVAHSPKLRGKLVTTQLTLYQEGGEEVEICVKVDFQIV